MEQLFGEAIRVITVSLEAVGVLVIIVGTCIAIGNYLRQRHDLDAYKALRRTLGRSILLGLELLVAADIINTVAVEPTMDSIAVLGAIVLIRTFLSLSLEVEISGSWPWARHRSEPQNTIHGRDSD